MTQVHYFMSTLLRGVELRITSNTSPYEAFKTVFTDAPKFHGWKYSRTDLVDENDNRPCNQTAWRLPE